jgi:hypothetical protein
MRNGLSPAYASTVPAHPAGSIPLDSENEPRIKEARQQHKQTRKVSEKLSKFLNRISDEIDDLDRERRLRLFRSQIKAHQYMDGNFLGYVDVNCEWRPADRKEGETWYTDNQLYAYWRTALMELSRTQTDVLVNAMPGASDDLVAAAKFAKSRIDANRERTFNARLKQTENSYALLNGITFRYTFLQWNHGSGGARKERVPTLEKYDVEPQTEKICANCAKPGLEAPNIDGMPEPTEQKCLSCGSNTFIEIDTASASDTIIGYEDLPTCENAWIVPNPIGIIVSLQASCIEETPFLKWKQMILRSVLESKFPGIEFPSTGTESTELRYITNQQKATPANQRDDVYEDTTISDQGMLNSDIGRDAGRELELLEFHQHWLDYPVYCNKKFDEDISLGRGKILKAGEPLGSAYPIGLYYATCGDLVADIWDEDKNKKWTSSPYGMRPGSMYGSGSSQALSDQELLNDLKALTMANAWSNAVPREFVDPSMIKELSADPQIPTNVNREPGSPDFGYHVSPGISLSAEVYALGEEHKASMQNKIGAMSGAGAGGLADAQKWGDTATAISIKRDLAVGRFAPDLELMADQLDRPQAIQFLENEQKYFTPEQWERQKGEHGEDALKAFLKCDIRRDLIVTISPGSYMPKSDAQMQAKIIAFAQLLPVLAQTANPEIIAFATEVFGIPEYLGGWNSDRAHAGKVVKRFQALAEEFIKHYGDLPTNALDPIQGVDPATGEPIEEESPTMKAAQAINEYAKLPVDVFLDNHAALEEAYKDWRTTDEGREGSNVLVAAVAFRVMQHKEAVGKQGAMASRQQIAAQEPLKEEAEAEQAKALEAQNAAAEQEQAAADQATQMQAADRMTDYNDRDEQRNHAAQLERDRMQHEKDMKTADVAVAMHKAEQQAKAAKAKPAAKKK